MATRTIRTGIGSYVDPEGRNQFGMFGDEVEVHEDDVERFDRLNPEPIAEVVEVVGETVTDEEAASLPPAVVERVDGAEVPVGDDGIPVLEVHEDDVEPVTKPAARRSAK
jgi:hypothetical protein